MRFDGELESAYRRDQFYDRLRYLRINLAVLAAISLTVIQIDRIVVPVIGRIVPDLARTGVMLPLLLLGFALTFIRRADVWYPRYIALAMAAALAGMSYISLTAWGDGESRVFVRFLLAIVTVYFVVGLAFRSAIVVNAIGLAAYAAIAVSKGMPGVEMTHYLTTLVIGNIICIAGAYNLEHARRTAWLEGQRLAESALQDGLTGIHNRRRFDEHLQRVWGQSVRERKPIALLFADIDHFKPYNDRYGHQAGDEAMKAVQAPSQFAGRSTSRRAMAARNSQSSCSMRSASTPSASRRRSLKRCASSASRTRIRARGRCSRSASESPASCLPHGAAGRGSSSWPTRRYMRPRTAAAIARWRSSRNTSTCRPAISIATRRRRTRRRSLSKLRPRAGRSSRALP